MNGGNEVDKIENQHKDYSDENLDKELLTIKEVASLMEESSNVIRNWIKELRAYIPLRKNEAGYNVFDDTAIEQIRLIKQLHRERNYSIKQIDHYLATGGEPFTKRITKENSDELFMELQYLKDEITELKKYAVQQEQFNKFLLEHLRTQQTFISTAMEQKKSTPIETGIVPEDNVATSQEKKWWEFWR